MKKSIILFVAAVTFLALKITAHAGKPVDENGIRFATGFPSRYHYNLNVLGKQGNDLILLGLIDRNGSTTFSSDRISLNRTSTKV